MERSRDINAVGTVTSITYPAHGSAGHLDVIISLLDESESTENENLLLRFLGRRTMSCLEIGSCVRIHGTLSQVAGTPIVFNPAMTIVSGQDDV